MGRSEDRPVEKSNSGRDYCLTRRRRNGSVTSPSIRRASDPGSGKGTSPPVPVGETSNTAPETNAFVFSSVAPATVAKVMSQPSFRGVLFTPPPGIPKMKSSVSQSPSLIIPSAVRSARIIVPGGPEGSAGAVRVQTSIPPGAVFASAPVQFPVSVQSKKESAVPANVVVRGDVTVNPSSVSAFGTAKVMLVTNSPLSTAQPAGPPSGSSMRPDPSAVA